MSTDGSLTFSPVAGSSGLITNVLASKAAYYIAELSIGNGSPTVTKQRVEFLIT